ncbi:MAG: hypothetical protein NVSMB48_00460 [Marmoricola sp.]
MLAFLALAALAAVGLVGLVVLVRGGSLIGSFSPRSSAYDSRLMKQLGIALALGIVVLAVTRWPSAALAAVAVSFLWPNIAGGTSVGRRQLEKVEALAAWTESLRDTAGAASGLEQAIATTVTSAPPLLTRPVRSLSSRLVGRVPLPIALAMFAEEVGDPSADMVVAALSLNARQRSGGLDRILTSLAFTFRVELEMRRKVEHQRRSLRRQALQISGLVIAFVVIQTLFSRSIVHAYGTLTGQLVLLMIVTVFVGGLIRIRRLSEPRIQSRFLATSESLNQIADTQRTGARV